MLGFQELIHEKADLVICMGDSLTHLGSLQEVDLLFKNVYKSLKKEGRFLLQFKDLTKPLINGDRFIPIRSDERTVFTCFLEWEPSMVGLKPDGSGRIIKVHDLIHVKKGIGAWELCSSWYFKLGISGFVVKDLLEQNGFSKVEIGTEEKMVFISALS
jgi:hypothetical protein